MQNIVVFVLCEGPHNGEPTIDNRQPTTDHSGR